MKDLAKRKRVMARSMRLGHCICDPKKPCPCDLFREKDVCLCAGERLEADGGPVRLTQLVEHAGCASKIDQESLKRALGGLTFPNDPRVLLGAAAGDDAGIFRLSDHQALVQTVDVFTPSVDDPYLFGQVAAANSVSDIYAMGGTPLTALSIVGFPIRTVPDAVMRDILRGGIDKMAEAGVSIIGGHSINDPEIKAGFAVTGLIDPARMRTHAGARPGDVLILTKPLGTGILAFAAQIGRAKPEWLEASARSMTTLNKAAAEAMASFDVHACTDITGFGLIGHVANLASSSGVEIEICWDRLPILPGVLECLDQGIASGGVERNRESSGGRIEAGTEVRPEMMDLCYDPQTSGGLLIVVSEDQASVLLARLHDRGVVQSAVVGRVLGTGTGTVTIQKGKPNMVRKKPAAAKAKTSPSCCAGTASEGSGSAGGFSAVQRQFQDFLKSANAPGVLDARTKQAIAVALSVLAKCAPCVKIHVRKAREMGFSEEAIDEAAWMAIAFGGSPLMMFYNELKKEL